MPNILIAGLGRFISADPNAAATFGPQAGNIKLLEEALQKATEAGYYHLTIDVDPNNPKESLLALENELKSKDYDLFVIGFGIRGNRDFTAVFEEVVNLSVSVSPKTRFGFSPAPGAVFETIQRVLEK